MRRLLVICGPTATGKTSLGISLAKKFNGEIISADSRQVYKEMDVGTGKDLPVNSKLKIKKEKLQLKIKNGQILKPYRLAKVPTWMLDVVAPDQEFSVAHYVTLAAEVIRDIWRRGKLPILVGGSGFYMRGLIDGIGSLGVEPDWELRKQLSHLAIKQLREILRETCPERLRGMNESDRQNPRRLIRAIEIALKIKNGKVKIKNDNSKLKVDKILLIGLRAPYKTLYQRIDKRVEKRVEWGVEREIRRLLKKGYSWENSALGTTLGYREWQAFFEKKTAREKTLQRWQFAEHHYARRQMTWFKKTLRQAFGPSSGRGAQSENKKAHWFDISQKDWQKRVEDLVKRWYSKNDAEKS